MIQTFVEPIHIVSPTLLHRPAADDDWPLIVDVMPVQMSGVRSDSRIGESGAYPQKSGLCERSTIECFLLCIGMSESFNYTLSKLQSCNKFRFETVMCIYYFYFVSSAVRKS